MYRYPDVDDKSVARLFNEHWEDGGLEDQYISESISNLHQTDRNVLLDVGCGPLIPQYLRKIKRVSFVLHVKFRFPFI